MNRVGHELVYGVNRNEMHTFYINLSVCLCVLHNEYVHRNVKGLKSVRFCVAVSDFVCVAFDCAYIIV